MEEKALIAFNHFVLFQRLTEESWLCLLMSRRVKRVYCGTKFLEKVCDNCVMGHDQLLGMLMGLAFQGYKIDEAILIP